jgi:hypothetical protein
MFAIITNVNATVTGGMDPKACRGVLPPVSRPGNSKPHILWKPAILAALVLLRAGLGMATTIVAIRSPDYVVLAADSQVTVASLDGNTAVAECKIQEIGANFVGAAGYFRETPRGFSAFDIARKASNQGGDLMAIADRFERAALEPFKASVQRFRQDNPALFASYCNNRDCLEVAFVGQEGGINKLSVRCFRVTTPAEQIVVEPSHRLDCPGNCQAGAAEALLGIHENADALINRTPHFWMVKGIVAGIDQLIGTEVEANPGDVGLPISILTIDGSGPHWEPGHRGVCPDAKK